MPKYLGVVRNSKGDAVPSARVYVYAAGGTTTSSIYEDSAHTTAESNPLTAAADGTYEFYAPAGNYRIDIALEGYDNFSEDDIAIGPYADAYSVSGADSGVKIGSAQLFYHTTNPEGVITASPGSFCVVNAGGTGTFWIKVTGTSNTGWSQV